MAGPLQRAGPRGLRSKERRLLAGRVGAAALAFTWSVAVCVSCRSLGSRTLAHSVASSGPGPCSKQQTSLGRREAAAAALGVAAAGSWSPGAARAELSTLESKISSTADPLPKWASELDPFPKGLFGQGTDPVISWLPLGPKTDPRGASLVYPAWLAGTWNVTYLRQGTHFPAGLNNVGLSTAGVEKGSILRLPDVGAEPKALWRFSTEPGGGSARADWSYTLPSILKAFLSKAEVVGGTGQVEGIDGPGLEVSYKAPGGVFPGGKLKEMSSTLTWLAGDTWQDAKVGSFLSVEWLRQRQRGEEDVASDVYNYKVLTVLRRLREGQIVGVVRVASFLQSTDSNYDRADGKPAAVYEYQVSLAPAPLAIT